MGGTGQKQKTTSFRFWHATRKEGTRSCQAGQSKLSGLRLHEEMTGETISRVTTRSRVTDCLATKRPEIAFTSLGFYQNSLGKFLDFLGPKADAPISEVTKADIVAFRNRLLTQVSAKTANHD